MEKEPKNFSVRKFESKKTHENPLLSKKSTQI